MPCPSDGYPPSREEVLFSNVVAAALCGILAVDTEVLDLVDWKEAGVTKGEVLEWWGLHRVRGAERKAQEKVWAAERKARERAKYEKLSKKFGPKS